MTGAETAALVHLVDDDQFILRALHRVLAAAGQPCTTWESAEAFPRPPPGPEDGCVVVDLRLPGADGLALQARLAERDPTLPIVFLTGRGDIDASVTAMKGGSVDFLTKPVEPAALLAAIATAQRAAQGEEGTAAAQLARLTPREREVLALVVGGKLNKQIAGDIGIAEKTIKVHRAGVMQKLSVRPLADLVHFVVRRPD